LEAAQRVEEVAILEARIKEREAFLSEAIKDLPRRDSLRKLAGEKTAQAQTLETEIFKVSETLKALQDQAETLREESKISLESANFTLSEINRQADEARERKVKARQEFIASRETNVRSAELALTAAKGGPPEIVQDRQKALDKRKAELAEALQEADLVPVL
jgi:predicted  nucleic acid-binding Zn-ribbon protein